MNTTTYKAEDIFTVRACGHIDGNPECANLRIESNKRLAQERVSGAGLYAIHFQDRLLYIGQFRGTGVNPFGGDVCSTRWSKHIGTLTLRDRRISFGPRAISDMKKLMSPNPPLADIVSASEEASTISIHRGRVSSLNRALFAAEHWNLMSQITDVSGLTGFTITYSQIENDKRFDHKAIRSQIESAEKDVISQLHPRCNAEIPAGTARDMNITTTGRILQDALIKAFDDTNEAGTPIAQVQPKAIALPEPGEDDAPQNAAEEEEQADDLNLDSAEDAFMERLGANQDALSAVDRLADAFTEINNAYIWHTYTNNGDLRIRRTGERRGFSNVARIFWQPALVRFNSEINLTAERCLELGASTARPNHQGKTLPTQATFDIPDAIDALIFCLVEAAAQ